jgi:hypothetical protein
MVLSRVTIYTVMLKKANDFNLVGKNLRTVKVNIVVVRRLVLK